MYLLNPLPVAFVDATFLYFHVDRISNYFVSFREEVLLFFVEGWWVRILPQTTFPCNLISDFSPLPKVQIFSNMFFSCLKPFLFQTVTSSECNEHSYDPPRDKTSENSPFFSTSAGNSRHVTKEHIKKRHTVWVWPTFRSHPLSKN